MSRFQVYKKGQGKYTRSLTFLSAMLLAVVGAYLLSRFLQGYQLTAAPHVRFGLPTLIVVAIAVVMFWLVNRPRSADFLIATEGEMKKVSWSSRKEIVGSTKVVIITTFLMAALLFGVDLIFIRIFSLIGVSG